jgi:hypothetical protein
LSLALVESRTGSILMSVKYAAITFVAVGVTWLLHEFAHWTTGEVLGNNMVMTLNTCYPKNGQYLEIWHGTVVTLGGPLITLLQAIIFYFLLRAGASNSLFPFLLVCLYMRSLAGVMNFINLNDEGRISSELGLGLFTFPIIIFVVLLYLVLDIKKRRGYSGNAILVTTLFIMLYSSILILSDQFLKILILG